MKNTLEKIARPLYVKYPILRPFIGAAYDIFFAKPKFAGAGMKTFHEVPWNDAYKWKIFRQSSIDIKKFDFTKKHVSKKNIDNALWRNWNVSFAIRYAIEFANTTEYNFVECGVGDGITAFFALREIQEKLGKKFSFHLYDSWGSMRKQDLVRNELQSVSKYSGLSIERTKGNLQEFEDNVIYHQGYIPESFNVLPSSPQKIVYLSIDLNSAKPTIDTLNLFYPRLARGGIIIFDDYGWQNYKDTKEVVDAFFSDKPGILLKLPTAQAIYFR